LERRAVTNVLPLPDRHHVLRDRLVPDLDEILRHRVTEVVLPTPLVRHPVEEVGRAGLSHERREVLRLVPLVRDGHHLDLVPRLLRELLAFLDVPLVEVGLLVPVGPVDELLRLRRRRWCRHRHHAHRHGDRETEPHAASHAALLSYPGVHRTGSSTGPLASHRVHGGWGTRAPGPDEPSDPSAQERGEALHATARWTPPPPT